MHENICLNSFTITYLDASQSVVHLESDRSNERNYFLATDFQDVWFKYIFMYDMFHYINQ